MYSFSFLKKMKYIILIVYTKLVRRQYIKYSHQICLLSFVSIVYHLYHLFAIVCVYFCNCNMTLNYWFFYKVNIRVTLVGLYDLSDMGFFSIFSMIAIFDVVSLYFETQVLFLGASFIILVH